MQTAHTLHGQTFWLSSERTLYWEEKKTMVIADLHLGKTGHFRRSGIAVPPSIYKADLQRLVSVVFEHKAERLIIVGDMTHSSVNKELELFLKWRRDFSSLHIDLVKGNHDILRDDWYREANITLFEDQLLDEGFCFRHGDAELKEELNEPLYTFSGHVHPGVILRGQGKQHLRLPCFYFGLKQAILPAFSHFTGTYTVSPEQGETVYALAGKELIRF